MSNSLEKVGNRIRSLRKQSTLSQQTLAERAGISYKYLGEIERGKVNLSVEILLKIAQALHVEAGEILDHTKQENSMVSKARFILSELSEKDLAIALDMLGAFQKHSDKE